MRQRPTSPLPNTGFSLLELMITLSLLAVLMTWAVPAFTEFRERTIVRGAADQLVAFWAQARFEAIRRDTMVKVSVARTGDGTMCLGASTTTDPADTVSCDCFTAGACNVSQYPAASAEWRGARAIADPTFGGGSGVLVIDPRRGTLTEDGDEGVVTVRSPSATRQYQLRFVVTSLGRAALCEPVDAPLKLPDYSSLTCG